MIRRFRLFPAGNHGRGRQKAPTQHNISRISRDLVLILCQIQTVKKADEMAEEAAVGTRRFRKPPIVD